MNKKLALLTLKYFHEDQYSSFHPDKTQLELGIYQLREPNIASQHFSGHLVEDGIQTQLENGLVIASKTFVDDRNIGYVAEELAKDYDGISSGGIVGSQAIVVFRSSAKDRIQEYFF